MPSKYWEDSADLSRDSSAESSQDLQQSSNEVENRRQPREESNSHGNEGGDVDGDRNGDEDGDRNGDEEEDSVWELHSEGTKDAVDQSANIGALARVMATNFQLPSLQPREHASLFYLSLIEGRCRTQAATLINAGRTPEDCFDEDHPEVSDLTSHLFAEMSKELLKAGMIPEEFVGRPLPELRLYLSSFDTMVLKISSTRPQDLPEFETYRALDSSYNRSRALRGSVETLASSEDSLEPVTGPYSARQPQIGQASRDPGHRKTSQFKQESQRALTSTRFNPLFRPSFRTPFNGPQPHTRGTIATSPLDQPSYESAASDDYIGFQASPSSSFQEDEQEEHPRALVLRNRSLAMSRFSQPQTPAAAHRFIHLFSSGKELGDATVSDAVFDTQYKDKVVIGKGGFGRVYKARYYLDQAVYAIKQIVISATKLDQLFKSGKLTELGQEVQALAKVNHPHIVRYHHSWIETRSAKSKLDGRASGSASDESDSDENTSRIPNKSDQYGEVAGQQSISHDNFTTLDREFREQRSNRAMHRKTDTSVVFGDDSPLHSTASPLKEEVKSKYYRHPCDPDSEDDDDDGDDDDDNNRKEAIITTSAPNKIDFDAIIYIKMTAYPLSLADYIEKDLHCYHPLPTIRILQRLLAGIQYLHRKQIIHRDLKPGNVFLAYPEEEELCVPPSPSFVDTSCCQSCPSSLKEGKAKFISPCIGDFGLVADLKVSATMGEVGTKFYTPAKKEAICEKLDVYALGVIAFELSVPFGTGSERVRVLEGLREGKLPLGWEEGGGEVLGEGVRGMVCLEREGRWGCERVAEWLEEVEGRLRKEVLEGGKGKGKEAVR